ncbi:hypothetical protein ES705_33996 [subsurface metagenome]
MGIEYCGKFIITTAANHASRNASITFKNTVILLKFVDMGMTTEVRQSPFGL